MSPKFFLILLTCRILIGSPLEIVELLLQLVQQDGQNAAEDQEECAGVEQRPDQALLDELLARPDDFVDADDAGQGGILDQGDDLVAHGGNDALDDLQQHHPEEDLAAGHTQHLTGLILALGNGFDAAAVDLREVAGVVDGEGHDGGSEAAHGRGHIQDQARAVENDDQLEHQGRAADDPDKGAGQPLQGLEIAHGAEADDETKRNGEQQGHQEDLDAFPETRQKLQCNRNKHKNLLTESAPHGWWGATWYII